VDHPTFVTTATSPPSAQSLPQHLLGLFTGVLVCGVEGVDPASSARVVTISGGKPVTALVLDVSEGMIQTIRLVANPEKLDGVRAVEAP
jgi:hypothetical protein